MVTMEAHLPERAMAAVESPELWHRRFGHLGFDNLAKLADGHSGVWHETQCS